MAPVTAEWIVCQRGGDDARGKGGGVQLVIGMQDQGDVQCAGAVSEGFSPFSIHRKFAACDSDRSGGTISLPLRSRS